MVPIDDPADPRIADYRELTDQTARRRIEGGEFFVAEGPVAIDRLLASPHRVRSVLVSEQKYDRLRDLLAPGRGDGTGRAFPVYVVDRATLGEIVGFDLHRGAIAAAERLPDTTLAALVAGCRRIAVLEGLNDPENLGAIARSARALGIDGLVLDPTCIDPYTRRTVRVSMGEVLHLPRFRVDRGDWPGDLGRLRDAGFETWALTPGDGAADLWDLSPPHRLAVVVGAEGPGLHRLTIAACDRAVRIPIRPDVDSLNVGAAAAITFAAITRGVIAGQTGRR